MRIVAATTVTGPYIVARYRRFSEQNPHCDLILLEFGRVSNEYAWAPTDDTVPYRREVLSEKPVQLLGIRNRVRLITAALNRLRPEVVVVCGYGVTGMGVVLHWARRQRPPVPVVMLSDSTADDQIRTGWKEWVKSRLMGQCGSALVAGSRHRAYIRQLGMPDELTFEGYDVVDNGHFAPRQEPVLGRTGQHHVSLPKLFFLSSARFLRHDGGIDRPKNLHRLLSAYARYLGKVLGKSGFENPWSLVILGDGPLRPELEAQISTLKLDGYVHLAGFLQYDELPTYYKAAGAFVLPSLKDTWGLVVNEAMAAGLPVLVSERCGCAPDLVEPCRNGYVFDPLDVEELARLMVMVSSDQCDRKAMGKASREMIRDWSTDKFAAGLAKAVAVAKVVNPAGPNVLDRILLGVLAHR